MRRNHRLRRGAQLVEMMLMMTFLGGVLAVLCQVSVSVSRLNKVITNDAVMEQQTRHQLDQILQNVHESNAVLTSYVGTTTYSTDNSTTLVLQAPAHNAAGTMLGTNDKIVYFLSGSSAPYTLHQIVAPSVGSSRPAVADKVIASNVQSMTITYFVSQTFSGDGTSGTFSLVGYPSGPLVTRQVTVSSLPVGLGSNPGQVQFIAPTSLSFTTPPPNAAPINALYSVDPSLYASAINGIILDLKLSVSGQSSGNMATHTVEISSQANLKNHA